MCCPTYDINIKTLLKTYIIKFVTLTETLAVVLAVAAVVVVVVFNYIFSINTVPNLTWKFYYFPFYIATLLRCFSFWKTQIISNLFELGTFCFVYACVLVRMVSLPHN